MQNQMDGQSEAAPEAGGPRWLMELRPLDVCAIVGALVFIGYRYFCG